MTKSVRFLLIVLVALFVFSVVMVIKTNLAHAENVSPEVGTYQLFVGEKPEFVIPDKIGKTSEIFVFPWFKVRTNYSDTKVSYRNREWNVGPAAPRFEEHINYWVSGFVFFVVGVIVLIGIAWLVSFGRKLMGTAHVLRGFSQHP